MRPVWLSNTTFELQYPEVNINSVFEVRLNNFSFVLFPLLQCMMSYDSSGPTNATLGANGLKRVVYVTYELYEFISMKYRRGDGQII